MRYSQLLIVVLALLWVFLPLSQANRFLFLGLIAVYLAGHNFMGYTLARKGSLKLKKYEQMKKKLGDKWGPPVYMIVFVFLPLALGLYVAVTGLLMGLRS
ncbi:MAG: hypothetical protein ACOWWO_06500 [Peptococcaceae bacterium]